MLLISALALTACKNPQAPVYVTLEGQNYQSADAARVAYKALTDQQTAAVTPVADRIGGRLLVVLPDADRVRPLVAKSGTLLEGTTSLLIEFGQAGHQAVVDSIKRSNLFDVVETSVRNDTENPPDTGYDYVLWFRVATTGPNHTGQVYGRWMLRRGSGTAEEGVTFDPGVPQVGRYVSFVQSTRSAAARLGGPALASGASAGRSAPVGGLTGIAVSAQGDIVTSDHGVNSCGSMSIHTRALVLPAKIVARDRLNDLALLHIDHGFAAPAIFRDGAGIRQAETVLAIGFPYGAQYASSATVTSGSISSLTGARDDTRLLQFTAPIQPGNSGGPVLDPSGHVVGLVTAKMNASPAGPASGDIPQNVNLAIKSSVIREFLDTNAVKYRAAPSGAELRPADIAEQAKQAVVYVECLR
jgi:S1-C subfamily serine protease